MIKSKFKVEDQIAWNEIAEKEFPDRKQGEPIGIIIKIIERNNSNTKLLEYITNSDSIDKIDETLVELYQPMFKVGDEFNHPDYGIVTIYRINMSHNFPVKYKGENCTQGWGCDTIKDVNKYILNQKKTNLDDQN